MGVSRYVGIPLLAAASAAMSLMLVAIDATGANDPPDAAGPPAINNDGRSLQPAQGDAPLI